MTEPITVAEVREALGVNFASGLNEKYVDSWPLFDGPEGIKGDVIYEHNINCIKPTWGRVDESSVAYSR